MIKNLPANAGNAGSIPELKRSPGEGNGKTLQYSCLGNPMNRGTWQATVHGVKTKEQRQYFKGSILIRVCQRNKTNRKTSAYLYPVLLTKSGPLLLYMYIQIRMYIGKEIYWKELAHSIMRLRNPTISHL